MKLIRLTIALCSVAFLSLNTQAQKVRLIEGDLSALKGNVQFNLQFAYDDMRVGKYDKEADYVAAKTQEYNRKTSGRGDTWAKEWVSDRHNRYEPKFTQLFEKEASFTVTEKGPYTIIFKTLKTEPGYDAVVKRKNAEISGEAWIVETANPSHVIAKLSVANAPGDVAWGNDYDTGARLAESYATAGRGIAKFLKRQE
jgi:hypothetical protein